MIVYTNQELIGEVTTFLGHPALVLVTEEEHISSLIQTSDWKNLSLQSVVDLESPCMCTLVMLDGANPILAIALTHPLLDFLLDAEAQKPWVLIAQFKVVDEYQSKLYIIGGGETYQLQVNGLSIIPKWIVEIQ